MLNYVTTFNYLDDLPLDNSIPEIIDLLLEKGGSLNAFSTYANLKNWQIPLENFKKIPKELEAMKIGINENKKLAKVIEDQHLKALSQSGLLDAKKQYEYIKNNISNYRNNILAIIKKHAQRRGETEILKGIAEYEKALKKA